MITFDEIKRQANLKKHGLDFVGCEAVFDQPVVSQEDASQDYGEQRLIVIGWLRGQWIHLTYTERGDALHVISLRKATRHELIEYRKAVSKN